MKRWLIAGVVLVAVAAVGWLVLDRTVLQDRRLKKDATIVSEDAQGLLQHEGRPESSVLAAWQVNGKVSGDRFARQIFP